MFEHFLVFGVPPVGSTPVSMTPKRTGSVSDSELPVRVSEQQDPEILYLYPEDKEYVLSVAVNVMWVFYAAASSS